MEKVEDNALESHKTTIMFPTMQVITYQCALSRIQNETPIYSVQIGAVAKVIFEFVDDAFTLFSTPANM